jgi:adenylate cyclase
MSPKQFRFSIVFASFLIVSLAMGSMYVFLPNAYQNIDNRLRDLFFQFRGEIEHDDRIVIVDIDEKSLRAIGQWPWERPTIATMIDNLTKAEAGIIGLDIVFAEADKTSPEKILKQLSITSDALASAGIDISGLRNHDAVLGESIEASPTILGYVFDFDLKSGGTTPQIPAIFIEKGKGEEEFLFAPKGVLSNVPAIQDKGYSSGYLNNVPDESGIITSVPLLMKYDETIYPSLAFEMVRIALSAEKVSVSYDDTGVQSIKAGDLLIPTDRYGRLYVNYTGAAKAYPYLSAYDVINGTFDPKEIAGKFVLIGTSAYGLMDLRSTPVESVMPGVQIHANVIDNLLNQTMLYRPDWAEGIDLVMIYLIAAMVILGISYLRFSVAVIALGLVGGVIFYGYYYLLFHHYLILNFFFPFATYLTSLLVFLGIKYFFEIRQKEMIKSRFSQKVSAQVVEDLIRNEDEDHFASHEEEVSIFFSDIRSFTTISEQLGSPHKIVEFLNYYMTEMADSIVMREGTIDKFIGDAIMAYWNAPNHVQNHADMAVSAALEQIEKRSLLNEYIAPTYGFNLDYGIGINTGLVTVGDIGSKGRSDYTVIGDAVNLASRLEGLCKYYGVRLIISEFTKVRLEDSYTIRELDRVRVKGKHEPVKIFEVISKDILRDSASVELKLYNGALDLFQNRCYDEAYEQFVELERLNDHKLYKLYMQRCRYLMDNKIENFDGVFEFDFK